MDATLEGFERCYARGPKPSVILPYEMMADTRENLIGNLAPKLLNTPGGWSPNKEQMRGHLEHLTRMHLCSCLLSFCRSKSLRY